MKKRIVALALLGFLSSLSFPTTTYSLGPDDYQDETLNESVIYNTSEKINIPVITDTEYFIKDEINV